MSTRRWSTGETGGVGINDVAIDSGADAEEKEAVKGRARAETTLGLAPGGVDQPAFGFITQQRQTTEESMKADRYARAMAGMAKRRQLSVEHLVSGFDWAGLPSGSIVVDVGGGNGHCSKAIAHCNPSLKFIVQDANAAFAKEVAANELGGRLKFMTYDFFAPQTATGDVYLLRRILHHHSDQDAVRILQAQLEVARKKPGSRIVVMDNIAVHSGTLSTLEERKTRYVTLSVGLVCQIDSFSSQNIRYRDDGPV